MNTGPFISPLVTYTITFDEHIATALCCSVSSLSLKVGLISVVLLFVDTYVSHPATHESRNDASFRKFRRQLLHSSIAKILESLKPGMTTPEIVRFPDGHFRRVIYGLGPYIADYPEQALLACVVQGWCAKYVLFCADFDASESLTYHVRCTAPANDLNSGQHVRRSQAHAELLVEEFELGMLWDEYGLVGDIIVRTILSCFSILY
jgi:hypothetical protein